MTKCSVPTSNSRDKFTFTTGITYKAIVECDSSL
jgi:hypothetical protein